MSASTVAELRLSVTTLGALKDAGYRSVEQILQAPAVEILKVPKLGRRGYNELVTTLVEEGFLAEDACRWGQVPHREKRVLAENSFGELTNFWLATFCQPGANCCSSVSAY